MCYFWSVLVAGVLWTYVIIYLILSFYQQCDFAVKSIKISHFFFQVVFRVLIYVGNSTLHSLFHGRCNWNNFCWDNKKLHIIKLWIFSMSHYLLLNTTTVTWYYSFICGGKPTEALLSLLSVWGFRKSEKCYHSFVLQGSIKNL